MRDRVRYSIPSARAVVDALIAGKIEEAGHAAVRACRESDLLFTLVRASLVVLQAVVAGEVQDDLRAEAQMLARRSARVIGLIADGGNAIAGGCSPLSSTGRSRSALDRDNGKTRSTPDGGYLDFGLDELFSPPPPQQTQPQATHLTVASLGVTARFISCNAGQAAEIRGLRHSYQVLRAEWDHLFDRAFTLLAENGMPAQYPGGGARAKAGREGGGQQPHVRRPRWR